MSCELTMYSESSFGVGGWSELNSAVVCGPSDGSDSIVSILNGQPLATLYAR